MSYQYHLLVAKDLTIEIIQISKEHSRTMFKLIKDIMTNSDKINYIKKYERDISDCFIQLIYHILRQYP